MLEAPPGAAPQCYGLDLALPAPAHTHIQADKASTNCSVQMTFPRAARITLEEKTRYTRPAERKPGTSLATERQTAPPRFLPPAEKQVQTPSASGSLGKQLWSKAVETQSTARRTPAARLEQPGALDPFPVAYHVFNRESSQELPARFRCRCRDSFAHKPLALVLQRHRGGAVPGPVTTSAS